MLDDKDREPMGDEDLEQDPEEEQDPGDDTEGCEEECEPEEGAGKKGKGKGKKDAAAKSATPAPTAPAKPTVTSGVAKKFTFPFLVRGAGNTDFYELNLEHGRAYAVPEIRQALIDAGYEEYQETNIDLTATSDGYTLIVHIKGSQKGGSRYA